MKRIIAWLAGISLALGVFLTVLNLLGLGYQPDRHPKTNGTHKEKAGIALNQPDAVFKDLYAVTKVQNKEDIKKVTTIFSSGVMHYWPEPGQRDENILYGWRENWVLALAANFEAFLLDAGILSDPKFGRLERFGYENIISKGVGFCSQVSLAVTDYLEDQGVHSYVWGLDGHVVSVVGPLADGQQYIVDADYGVYLPYSREEIEKSPDIIRSTYVNAGYTEPVVQKLVEFYGPKGNEKYSMGRLEVIFEAAKWGVPILMMLLGAVFLRFARRR